MTVELMVAAPERVISGIGPYGVPHPYEEDTLEIFVIHNGARIELSNINYTVSPLASTTTGNVFLTPAAATLYAGASLFIHRNTAEEQGWVGLLGERERGLERQLDRMVMVDQDQDVLMSRTLRSDREMQPFVPRPGEVLMFDENGQPVSGIFSAPTAQEGVYITAPYVSRAQRIHKIGGVLRQNTLNRSHWQFLGGTHLPLGFDPTYPIYEAHSGPGVGDIISPRAAGDTLLVFWKKNTDARQISAALDAQYQGILSGVVGADEVLARDWGIKMGARVTRSGMAISGSMSKTRHMRIYWSGSGFVVTDDGYQPFGSGEVSVTFDNEVLPSGATATVLTVTHPWLPGNALQILPDARSGIPAYVLDPVQYQVVSNTQFKVIFKSDPTSYYLGPCIFAMSFRATKTYNGPLLFDGTNGFDAIPWSTDDVGNIWIDAEMWSEL